MPRWLDHGTTFHFLQAVLRRSATQHWRYSHAERASQCTPSPTIDYHNATQTINCFDVNTRNFGLPPGGAPRILLEKELRYRIGKPFHPRSSCRRAQLPPGLADQGSDTQVNICVFNKPFHPRSSRVAARQSRPASAIRVLIRRIQHRESRIAPLSLEPPVNSPWGRM